MTEKASPHFRIETLAPGVHAAVASPLGFGLCNSGIVDLGEETLVFDTMLTPMAARDLYRNAERLTGHPPAWAVNSHWHGDHIWGNSEFADGHVVSSRTVRANILKRSRAQFIGDRREMRRELPLLDRPNSPFTKADRPLLGAWYRGVLATPRSHPIVPPSVTFENQLVIEGSRRSVHLITYGGGHSPADVFAFLPAEGIIFTGDLAIQGFHPSVSDGWPSRWISILRRMERLRADVIVPGHGPPGSRRTLSNSREYLQDLDRVARVAARKRISLASLAQTPIPARYRRWRFSFMFAGNLARAYRFAQHRT
jgi:cyclase